MRSEPTFAASQEAERAVIGICLQDGAQLGAVIKAGVTQSSFLIDAYGLVFGAMLGAERAGVPFDLASMIIRFPELRVELFDATETAPVAQNVDYYAKEVATSEWTRRSAELMRRLFELLASRRPFEDSSTLRGQIAAGLEAVALGTSTPVGTRAIKAIFDTDVFPTLERAMETSLDPGKRHGIPTGLNFLDTATGGGFQRKAVHVVAARPGKGKTTLAMNFAAVAASSGFHVTVFSLEMTAAQLAVKGLSRGSRVNSTKISRGTLSSDELDRVMATGGEMSDHPLSINDSFAGHLEAVEMEARKLRRQGKLDMLVIDYVQQLTLPGKWNRRNDELSAVTRRLKQLALDLDIAVIEVAQLNRDADQDSMPRVSQLKESGSIEQDADVILLMHRDDQGRTWIRVAKNRFGKDDFDVSVQADLGLNHFSDARHA